MSEEGMHADLEQFGRDRPVVVFSSCVSKRHPGHGLYSGGVKTNNAVVKLIRQNGTPAYIMTWDGAHEPAWILDYQPYISLQAFKALVKSGRDLRPATTWLDSPAFTSLVDRVWFYDCELKYTSSKKYQFDLLVHSLRTGKVVSVATHARQMQAWYMATFRYEPALLPLWVDGARWGADPKRRREGLLGAMPDNDGQERVVSEILERARGQGLKAEYKRIAGPEDEVLRKMQETDVFLGLNPGKDPLWGEGCPLTQIEAMFAGCAVVAYDVHGNREYILPGYSGLLAPRDRPGLLVEGALALLRDKKYKERIRAAGTALVHASFSTAGKWPLVRDWLEL